jgi:hypothetical protein
VRNGANGAEEEISVPFAENPNGSPNTAPPILAELKADGASI